MAMTSKFYNINYQNIIYSDSKISPIPLSDKNNRLSSEALELLELYPSLRILGQFTQNCWKYSELFPATTRVLVAKLFKNFSKMISGLEYESENQLSVGSSIYLAQIKIMCIMIEEWMIKHQAEAIKTSTLDGGVVVELNPYGYTVLNIVNSWNLFETVYTKGFYSKPFIIDHTCEDLLLNINFKF